jgi:hypothetical protein
MVHKIRFTVKMMQNLHVLLPRAPQEWLLQLVALLQQAAPTHSYRHMKNKLAKQNSITSMERTKIIILPLSTFNRFIDQAEKIILVLLNKPH